MKLTGPNWLLTIYLTLTLLLFANEKTLLHTYVFGGPIGSALDGLAGGGLGEVAKAYGRSIAAFRPSSSLEAKRANEQTRLLANFLNIVAAGTVSAIGLAQIVKPDESGKGMVLLAVAVGAGFYIHTNARNLLSLLKDESPAAYQEPAADHLISN